MLALRRSSLLAAIVAVGTALFAGSASAAASHPSLLFDKADIPQIRANLDGPLQPIKKSLEAAIHYPFTGGDYPKTPDLGWTYFSSDRRAIADTLTAFAFGAAVLDPATTIGAEARTLAKNYLVGICNYSDWVFAANQDGSAPDLNSAHFLFAAAVAYDWIYDSLSESERQKCRDRVAIEGKKMYEATKNAWWVPEYMQNHNWINHASLGMAALSFEGELSVDTGPWLEAAKANSEKVQHVLDLIEGGAWHEGTGYLHYGLDSLIPFSTAVQRLKGGSDYADTAIVRDFGKLRMYMAPPAASQKRGHVIWGDYSGSTNDNALLPLFYAGRKYRDGFAMYYAKEFIAGQVAGKGGFSTWPPSQRGYLTAVLFYDASVEPVKPPNEGKAWDLDFFAPDLQLMVSRSGWEDGGSMLAMKSGVFGGWANWERLKTNGWPGGYINFGHDHADDQGVHFFADGEWLTTGVPGYWIGRANGAPEANRTKYANSLLVDGNGQLGEGVRDCWMGSCTWWWNRQGRINLRGSTDNFSYMLGAGSQLYPSSAGLQSFGRSVLFVDRRFPIVRDVVRSSGTHRFETVWHAIDGASRDGNWLRLNAKNDRVLGVKVVAPAAFEMRTENQTATHLNKFDADGSMTAAMVRPSADTSAVNFLAALVPSRGASWNARPVIDPIDAAAPDRGLTITGLAGGERYDVVFNDAPEQTTTAGELTVTGMAGARKVIDGATVRAMVASGTQIAVGSDTWIEILEGGPGCLEVDVTADGVALSGDPRVARVYAPGATRVTYNGKEITFDRDGDYIRVPSAGAGGGEGGSGGVGGSTGGAGGAGEGGSGGTPIGEGGAIGGVGGIGGCGGVGEMPGVPGIPGGAGGSGGGGSGGSVGGGGSGAGGTGGSDGSGTTTKRRRFGCAAADGSTAAGLLVIGLMLATTRRRRRQ